MSHALDFSPFAVDASQSERAAFIRKTYLHLAGAILAFTAIEFAAFKLLAIDEIMARLFSAPASRILVLVAFIGVGMLADFWARSETSRGLQYLGLALYIVAEAVIFLPILYIASVFGKDGVIATAGIMTLCLFGGLTLAVFVTRKDFSYLGPIVCIGAFIALGAILVNILVPGLTGLGMVIAFGMVGLMTLSILYQTSQIMLHYRTTQYVAAALGLFASIATLFYYILVILLRSQQD